MFVPKTPKRADFCGCPPCPLCYDWVADQPVEVTIEQPIVQAEPLRVDGVEKMALDLLGREPTQKELKTLREAAYTIHVRNRNQAKAAEDAYRDADAMQRTERTIDALLKEAAKPKVEYKELNPVNIDTMARDESGELVADTKSEEQEALERMYAQAEILKQPTR